MTAREWLRSPEAVEVAARAIAGSTEQDAAQWWLHFRPEATAALTALLDRMPNSEEQT